MTIEESRLRVKSGAIYSPRFERHHQHHALTHGGGTAEEEVFACRYLFLADPTQRIKLEIYRMAALGRYDPIERRCAGGHLKIYDGYRSQRGLSRSLHVLCIDDARFRPPLTIYKDLAMARVDMMVRPGALPDTRLVLRYSFERRDADALHRGGHLMHKTDCEWIYRDDNCSDALRPCRFMSPNWPGIYPGEQQCRFYLQSKARGRQVRVEFETFRLPAGEHCELDYVRVYDSAAENDKRILATLCGDTDNDGDDDDGRFRRRRRVFISSGAHMLIEFFSGPLVPPFNYTGFSGTILFGNEGECVRRCIVDGG